MTTSEETVEPRVHVKFHNPKSRLPWAVTCDICSLTHGNKGWVGSNATQAAAMTAGRRHALLHRTRPPSTVTAANVRATAMDVGDIVAGIDRSLMSNAVTV